MWIPRFRQRRRHGGGGGSAWAAACNAASAASLPSSTERSGRCAQPVAVAASEGTMGVASAVEGYSDAWREAATDADLAFGWWVSATVPDRSGAATAYFAAFEREEKAALAYQDAWMALRSARACDVATTASAVS
jgi:hypothetical protein